MIPKTIHYCWFGGKSMPPKTKEYIDTWREKCPDYQIKEWNESNFNVKKYCYAKQAYMNKKWAFVSDVCRVEKLYKYGGIYLDVNTRVLKSFDDLLGNEFFIGFEQDEKVAPSVFGAKKKHWLLKKVLNIYKVENLFLPNGEMDMRVINDRFQDELLKVGLKKKDVLQNIGNDVKVYPKEYFQPRYWNSSKQDRITSKTHTIHYFGASWHDEKTRNFLDLVTSKNTPLISVIVPVYNVEKYLETCVNSVTNQTYLNLEIIIVDDKTLDNSSKIADDLAKGDERIRVIHKDKNEGLNMARATGFAVATGDFVTFVDGDDMLKRGCLMKALEVLIKGNADAVKFDGETFSDDEKEVLNNDLSDDQELILKNKADLYRTQFGLSNFDYPMTVWGGLYKKKTIDKIDWSKSNFRAYEDNFWMIDFLENVESVVYRNFRGYLYRQNDGDDSVLSKRLVGNSLNGKKVGYLETWDLLGKEFERVNKKYDLGISEDINNFMSAVFSNNVKKLVDNDKISDENNLEFLIKNMKYLMLRYTIYEKRIRDNELEISKLIEQRDNLQIELWSHEKVGRSAKLFLGNIKRKAKKILEDL